MNKILWLVSMIGLVSCSSLSNISNRIEETHYALYQQKALFVLNVEDNKVWFVNPTYTRCYYLKGKSYLEKWAPGDTMIIDNHMADFQRLKYGKNCNLL